MAKRRVKRQADITQGSRMYRGKSLRVTDRPAELERQHSRQRRQRKTLGLRIFAKRALQGLLIVALATWSGSRLYLLPVAQVEVSSQQVHQPHYYQSQFDQSLSGLWRFRPFYTSQANKLKQSITDEPFVESVNVTVPWYSRTVRVHVTEASPELTWADGKGNYYAVDAKGQVISNLDKTVADSTLSVRDTTSVKTEVGDYVLSSAQISFIKQINTQLNTTGKTNTLEIGEQARTLKFNVGGDYVHNVLFTTDREADEQLAAYKKTRTYLQERNLQPGTIDVRVPDKVYYQ